MSTEVTCAFCGQAVAEKGADPCALVVFARWRDPESEQQEQQFFSHAACLVSRMHPDVAVHAESLTLGRVPGRGV